MPEYRAERTSYLGLLALMLAQADTENWSYPYWNVRQIDAALSALAQAVRDGTVPLLAPQSAPNAEVSTTTGSIATGMSLEIGQTWVDEFGRETDAGPTATVSTGDGIEDPGSAPTLGAPTLGGFSGYEGGLLEVWFSWTDGAGGETLASPSAQVDVPYQTGGLRSEVAVTLPSTPAAAGAAGANIYLRHRGGNIVLAYRILTDDVDEVALTGAVADCYLSLPLANSFGSNKAIDITGAAAPAGAVLTRFYLRTPGASWPAADRRLRLNGTDEWDPASVIYPLTYTGATDQLTAGFPPAVSQVKAIRPVDLTAEVIGELPTESLPGEAVLEAELVRSIGEAVISGLLASAHAPADMGVAVATGEALNAAGRQVPAGTNLVIPAADETHPRIDLVCLADDGLIEGPTENASLKGSPAASPMAPSTPAGYLKLAEVLVDPAVTEIAAGKVTDCRYVVPTVVALDETLTGDLALHEADDLAHFTGTEKADRLLSPAQKTDLTDGNETVLHSHPGLGSSGHPTAVGNLLALAAWSEELGVTVRSILDARPQLWSDLISLALVVDELHATLAGSSRRVFSDTDRVCAGSANTDFTLDVVDEGLIVALSLTLSGTSPDIDFEIYRDASRTSLVKSWADVTASTGFREVLDWVNEESPHTGLAYCRVINNTANTATVTTAVTIKEV